jgi:hypothetical protein
MNCKLEITGHAHFQMLSRHPSARVEEIFDIRFLGRDFNAMQRYEVFFLTVE